MKVLTIKKDRLEELTKFGFVKNKDCYTYKGKRLCYNYTIRVTSWSHVLNINEYDPEDFKDSTAVDIPDVIMDLIEAGMVERYD